MRADVDGDGRPDVVTVRVDRQAYGQCAFYLTVSTARGFYSRMLGAWTLEMSKDDINVPMHKGEWPAAFPTVEEIADLGGGPNVIVLSVGEGAANLGIGFYGLSHGRIQLLRVGGRSSIWPGGTVMDTASVACSRGGPMRLLFADNVATRKHPNRWSFSSETYRRRGPRFVRVAHRTLSGSHSEVSAAARRARMPSETLTGCSIVRNPAGF